MEDSDVIKLNHLQKTGHSQDAIRFVRPGTILGYDTKDTIMINVNKTKWF